MKTILILGATGAIGRGITKAFAGNNNNVIMTARNSERLKK